MQGGSVGVSQSAETGSSTAMMDVDSMTSQVTSPYYHIITMYTTQGVILREVRLPHENCNVVFVTNS